MSEYVKLTDEVVIPLMEKHSITREEAEKRLQLLYKSTILTDGHPDDPFTQHMIDDFLSHDSDELAGKVAFDLCVSKCMEDKKFVKEYDRITGRNLTKVLSETNAGYPPKNAEKELTRFMEFVRKTVFAKWTQSMENDKSKDN